MSLSKFDVLNEVRTKQAMKKDKILQDAYPFPVIEEIDLDVVPQTLYLTKDFLFVSRVIWNIQWADPNPSWSEFGIDGALTNGLQIEYRGEFILPHGITTNGEFGETSYDVRLNQDFTAVKTNTLQSRLSFTRFTGDRLGLKIDTNKRFGIVVQDDLSGTGNTHVAANIEGWKYIV